MAQPEQPRTTLSITGADAEGFLQNLVTQDVGKAATLTYAALLTPQGKYLADFFLLQREEGYLLDVATSLAPALYQRLSMYKLRADVAISEAHVNVVCGLGAAPDEAFADPRYTALGWRGYGIEDTGEAVDWPAIRVPNCIPETGVELTSDTFILEAGFEVLNGVDFKKGCYVGQEICARMKHKTTLRKGFATVAIDGQAEVGTKIIRDEKEVGTIFTQSGGKAIAYLRFDRAGNGGSPMQAGTATITRV